MKRGLAAISAVLAVIVVGCSSGGASQSITKGGELAYVNFSEPASWEEGAYSGATLRVVDGVYRIDITMGDATLWWGQWGSTYDDTVIDVDLNQISERRETAYGVMCRVRGQVGVRGIAAADLAAIMDATAEPLGLLEATAEASASPEVTLVPLAETTVITPAPAAEVTPELNDNPAALEGDGYLFLIQGTGAGGIFRAVGRNLTALADWRVNEAIMLSPGENHMRAVCSGNYLALYVNGVLIAEATDDRYAAGQVALVAMAANRIGARVQFDNLQVSAVE